MILRTTVAGLALAIGTVSAQANQEPIRISVQSLQQLKGKTISVPFASTAHGMLLRHEEGRELPRLPSADFPPLRIAL